MRKTIIPMLLPALLTGCGMVAAFIPPIEIGDPLAVEGQQITVAFDSASGAALAPEASATGLALQAPDRTGPAPLASSDEGFALQASSGAQQTVTSSFGDVQLDLRGFSLAALEANVGLDPVVILGRIDPLATFPPSFTLTRAAAQARVSDEPHGEVVLAVERQVELRFELDEGSCGLNSCAYSFAGGGDLADALSIEVPRSERDVLATFVEVIRLDGAESPNQGSFTVMLEAESEPGLSGFGATFTLRSGGTLVRLGG